MQRGFATIIPLFIILIVLILSASFAYTQKNNKSTIAPEVIKIQTSQNPAYKNQELGFEFEYSEDLEVKIDSEEDFNKRGNGDFRKNFTRYVGYEPEKVIGAVAVLKKDEGSFENSLFTVWVFENPQKIDPQTWSFRYWYYPFVWGIFDKTDRSHIALKNETTVSGRLVNYAQVGYKGGKPNFYLITDHEKMFLIRVLTDDKIGEEVLSTFTFLK